MKPSTYTSNPRRYSVMEAELENGTSKCFDVEYVIRPFIH